MLKSATYFLSLLLPFICENDYWLNPSTTTICFITFQPELDKSHPFSVYSTFMHQCFFTLDHTDTYYTVVISLQVDTKKGPRYA